MCSKVVNQLERDFDLLGITAVEDKIQIGVPETVGTCKFFEDFKFWSKHVSISLWNLDLMAFHEGEDVLNSRHILAQIGSNKTKHEVKGIRVMRVLRVMIFSIHESYKSFCQYDRRINGKQLTIFTPFETLGDDWDR